MATPSEITEADSCFACVDDKWSAALYLLNAIRVVQGGAAMTAAEIAEAASTNCFQCIDDRWSAALYLLNQIVAGGSSGAQQVYIGRDPAAPDDPTLPAISFPSGGGSITQWDVASQTWV
jgi:hypothetical protein